jgi:2-methylcitrate dehydratase PrpD
MMDAQSEQRAARSMNTEAPTRALARFATHAGCFSPLARQRAVDAITDCVGCMLAGSREALSGPLLRVLPTQPRPVANAGAVLVGTPTYAAPADAALFNGTIAHALDYDDTNHPAYAHPSAVIVPTLLALAPLANATGADLVTAYILGLEVFGKLGRALNNAHYKRGWHATATFGTLAATVSAARVLRLSEAQTVMALGIAASAAGGLRVNFGSMVKPLHAGQAARNGVLAALLAREGFLASEGALENTYGYFAVFNDGIGVDPAPFATLGEPLEILSEFGLALKMYPSCGATHPGIEAALALHRDLGGAPIRSVRAGVCEMAFAPLLYVLPEEPLQGKFSMHFCLAAALLDGKLNLATFTREKIADPRIRALIPSITMELEERFRHDSEFPTVITVETTTGTRHERTVLLASGKPARWFTAQQLQDKFDDCAARALSAEARVRAFTLLRALDSGAHCAALLDALTAPTMVNASSSTAATNVGT